MTKILVSGSAGFIFSNFIIYALQETKWDLVSIDKLTYAGRLENIAHNSTIHNKRHKLYIGDVCDQHFIRKVFEIERPDVVIHGAACSHVDNSIEDSGEFFRTNVMGTHSMLEAAKSTDVIKMFVNFSTDETLGDIKSGSFLESDPLLPRNPYSASKASAELVGRSYYITHGVPVVTTRCCNVFGSRQNVEKLIPKVITNALSEKHIPVYGKGEQIREWIYVKDVFYAVKYIIEHGSIGETYHIGSGYEINNINLVRKIIDTVGADRNLIQFVKDRLGHDFRYSLNSNKLNDLGWIPKYDFDSAILHVVGWYKANRWAWRK